MQAMCNPRLESVKLELQQLEKTVLNPAGDGVGAAVAVPVVFLDARHRSCVAQEVAGQSSLGTMSIHGLGRYGADLWHFILLVSGAHVNRLHVTFG